GSQGLSLDGDAVAAARSIFQQTVGLFVEEAQRKGATSDPWENQEFRKFILGRVKRIVDHAKQEAGSAVVSERVLRDAADDVIRRTHEVCKIAVEQGRMRFAVEESAFEGQVCSAYVAQLAGRPVA